VLEPVRARTAVGIQRRWKWHAMHRTMPGCYTIGTTGPGRGHYGLFRLLENETSNELRALGYDRPQIVVINGMVKPNAALFTNRD
jgi:hypothetical protein